MLCQVFYYYAECRYAKCYVMLTPMPSVVLLSVINAEWHAFIAMVSVIMVSVVMLSVIMVTVVMLRVVMVGVVMLSVLCLLLFNEVLLCGVLLFQEQLC